MSGGGEIVSLYQSDEIEEKMTDNKLNKSLPEYLPEFFAALGEQIIYDNQRWGDTWKERGLVWNEKTQEQRFFEWITEKYLQHASNNKPFPWLKVAGEAMIGYLREKYLLEESEEE